MLRILCRLLASACFVTSASIAHAGNFTVDWNTLVYPTNNANPPAFVLTDQYGFQVDMVLTHTGTNTASFNLDEDTTFLGGINDIFIPADAAAGSSGFGESIATGTLTLNLPGTTTRVGVNGLATSVTDIDPSDGNAATDRCDFLTVTAINAAGGAVTPTLGYANGAPTGAGTNTVYLIGPNNGTGTSGAAANYRTIFTTSGGQIAQTNLNWAANQVHCLFYPAAGFNSPTSSNDNAGTLNLTFPNGTAQFTLRYDEVVENAYNVTNRNAAARGIGAYGATAFSVNSSITLDKQTTATEFAAAGNVIPYTYIVTNVGPLPMRPTQNVQINDDKAGLINCPAIPAAGIAAGGTLTCTANYTVTAADVTAGFVTNNATAGIGTAAQPFATRLQSNADTVTVLRKAIVGVQKITTGGVGGPHQFTGTNLTAAIANINTVTAGIAAPASATMIPVTTSLLPVQITETANANWVITGVTCTDSNTAASGNTNPVGTSTTRVVNLLGGVIKPGARITCVYTNAAANPALSILKTASTPGPVATGQTYTYRFRITNTGNVPITNVQAIETAFNGTGTPVPTPGSEALFADNAPTGDSSDAAANDGQWTTLGPGDVVDFTASYSVTLNDVETLQ
jgi:uncharacterized repeat protein (TIGR01451 family)